MDLIATIPQAAKLLHCSPVTLSRKCKSGEIVHTHKVCRRWFINLSKEWPVLFANESAPANAGTSTSAKQ